ncbi:hypothetical protein Agub_g11336 [Astrephomene gubernaculifera]|uniref:Uncharacterized protein n=1 Tax=Astrephomene gubernaculifera TaxID=47775 RepID=A0AAD3DZ67_9CHLO|nr:hypothetical protein Agub_g11336 [Astrephomene gubernaculifera]
MTKRNAETFASHESVPPGAVPFFAPSAKRICGRGELRGLVPPSPSDTLAEQRTLSSSSDEMSDACEAGASDPAFVNSAHWLAASAASCSYADRTQATTLHPLPTSQQQLALLGVLTPPSCLDAQRFLEHLADCMLSYQRSSSSCAAGAGAGESLGTALWHAFAELNVVMARHFSELPTSMLRGYHSFTRAPRAQLWERVAASPGAQSGAECYQGLPWHLALMRHLLEHVLGAYPSASCVLYTIEVPQWLRGWCARWGHPGAGPMRVLALFAFDASGSPSPRVLYIPCAE